jgi:CheY-like chemotaxis protein
MEYTAIVTDDVFMATKAQDILQRVGVISRRTPPDALEGTDPVPAALVLDLALPEDQRQEVVRWAKGRVPVVAFGPHIEAQALFWARQAGCAAVLTKGQLETRLGHAVTGVLTDTAAP